MTFERFPLLWNSPIRMQSPAYWCDKEALRHARIVQRESERGDCTLSSLFFLSVNSGTIALLSLGSLACVPLKIGCILMEGVKEKSSMLLVAQCVGRVFYETVGLVFLSVCGLLLPGLPLMDAYESLYERSSSFFSRPPQELFEELGLYEAFLESARCEIRRLKEEGVFTKEQFASMGEQVLHTLFCRAIVHMIQNALFTEVGGGIRRLCSRMRTEVHILLSQFSAREEIALSQENPCFFASLLLFRLSHLLKALDVREKEALHASLTCRVEVSSPSFQTLERASFERLMRIRNTLIAFKIRFVDRDFVQGIGPSRLLDLFLPDECI